MTKFIEVTQTIFNFRTDNYNEYPLIINCSAILLIKPYSTDTCSVTVSTIAEDGTNETFNIKGSYKDILLKLEEVQ
jgi:hypothetical protein